MSRPHALIKVHHHQNWPAVLSSCEADGERGEISISCVDPALKTVANFVVCWVSCVVFSRVSFTRFLSRTHLFRCVKMPINQEKLNKLQQQKEKAQIGGKVGPCPV